MDPDGGLKTTPNTSGQKKSSSLGFSAMKRL